MITYVIFLEFLNSKYEKEEAYFNDVKSFRFLTDEARNGDTIFEVEYADHTKHNCVSSESHFIFLLERIVVMPE